jgi:hypothetical protein
MLIAVASLKTIRRTIKTQERLAKILLPHSLGSVLFDNKGNIIKNWGKGTLAEERKRQGASVLEKIYEQLPKNLLWKFVKWSAKPTPVPTETEFEMFEKRLLGTARRILKQDFERILETLLPYRQAALPIRGGGTTERKRIHREKMHKICTTVKEIEDTSQSKTKAVKHAAERLGYPERTIWWNLSQARKRRSPIQ